jgi:hypothetical protein
MPINSNPASHNTRKGIEAKVIEEAKAAFVLTIYFGLWFCSLTFLGMAILDERPIPLTPFGMALIKAALCAKFMLIAEAIFPIKLDKNHGIIKSVFIESLLYLLIVIALNYFEAGIDGLIHGKEFLISMTSFGQRNPMHVLAMSLVYWLIVWPYLVIKGMRMTLGAPTTAVILFGTKK